MRIRRSSPGAAPSSWAGTSSSNASAPAWCGATMIQPPCRRITRAITRATGVWPAARIQVSRRRRRRCSTPFAFLASRSSRTSRRGRAVPRWQSSDDLRYRSMRSPVALSLRSRILERRRSENLPAVAFAYLCQFAASPLLLFQQPARLGRGIEKQHPSGFCAGTLPGVRHVARHEGTGAGAADRDLVADLEGDLAAEDIGHLVAVVMQVERALCPGGNG